MQAVWKNVKKKRIQLEWYRGRKAKWLYEILQQKERNGRLNGRTSRKKKLDQAMKKLVKTTYVSVDKGRTAIMACHFAF